MVTASAAELQAVSRRLMAAGDFELYRKLQAGITAATVPATDAVRRSALANLPKAGGLNEWVAAGYVKRQALRGARTIGVQVRVGKRGHDFASIDRGEVRHPVFGTWRAGVASQPVKPHTLSDPLRELQPQVVAACTVAIRAVAAEAGFV